MKKLCDQSQGGFALPTVLGLGLISMLLVAVILDRARSEQIGASLEARSDLALGSTEAGIARFRAFLDRHRDLAVRDSKDWLPDLQQLRSEIGNCESIYSPAAIAELSRYANGDWQELPTGQYRVVSYEYRADPTAQQIGIGRVVIEGRLGSGSNRSQSAIEVEIPIALNDLPLPAIWTKTVNLSASQKIAGSVRIWSCPVATDPDGVTGIDRENAESILVTTAPWTKPRPSPDRAKDLKPIQGSLTLPQRGDDPDENGNYNYRVAADIHSYSVNLPLGRKIQIKAKQRVNLYLEGNIHIGGQVLAEADQLRIYGGRNTDELSIESGAQVHGLIHAPLADGSVTAPTKNTKSGKLGGGVYGGLWLKSWNSDRSELVLPVTAIGSWNHLDLPLEERPGLRLAPLSSWRRREVTP
jgi:hypothetical protein